MGLITFHSLILVDDMRSDGVLLYFPWVQLVSDWFGGGEFSMI